MPRSRTWQWADAHWRKLVDQVRAGRSYRPKAWKDGARCAVALSFDSDHETNELRDGGKSIAACAGANTAPGRRPAHPQAPGQARRQGNVLRACGIGDAASRGAEGADRRGSRDRHHGWIHELNSVLPREAERDLMLRSADTLEKITGKRAVGMRTPSWDFSPNTLALEKEMGLFYDSSLMADEDCYELLLHGEETRRGRIAGRMGCATTLSFLHAPLSSLRPYTPPTDVCETFRRELDAAWDDGGVFQLTMHPHIIGYRSRIWIVDELIRHAKSKGKVWFATHEEVARWAKEHAA
jgi:hypothetical protein